MSQPSSSRPALPPSRELGKESAGDKLYGWDDEKYQAAMAAKPWQKDVKYYSKCNISALAAMKMLRHSLAGVDKGRKAGTNPIEVMGLLIGKPDGNSITVMDTYPLPVEGTETACIVDDSMNNLLIQLSDSLERRRKDRFVGWYHSHPFDVETYSHCHLSGTDVQTQLTWQLAMPTWVAIVVDPLRSLAKQEPEFGCFRCYPVNYEPPKTECPDGSVNSDESLRSQRWGNAHSRYYAMEMSYFNSILGNQIIDVMSRNNLWIRVLGSSTVMEQENRERFSDRVKKVTQKIDSAAYHTHHPSHGRVPVREELTQASQACAELALEQVTGHFAQVSKNYLFNSNAPASGSHTSGDVEMSESGS